jgi:NADPH:quinone reductase-like Zn-dependent oxidoreductase
VIAGSDGAGVVLKTGTDVTNLKAGDRVVAHMVQSPIRNGATVSGADDDTLPDFACITGGLGQNLDGTLATHGVFRESCVVKIGDKLTFEEAATLSCSGITAWNGLMGLKGREPKKGDWVLIQGTGGVSIAGLQVSRLILKSSLY